MKYINAEKLKEILKSQIKERKRWMKYSVKSDRQDQLWSDLNGEDMSILQIIDSLQQEQPINKNILTWRDVNEIERIINKVYYEFPHGIGEEAFGKLVLERFIDWKDDVQEQPEVDLEKEIEKYCRIYYNCNYPDQIQNGRCSPVMPHIVEAARHFYELGLKATKEE